MCCSYPGLIAIRDQALQAGRADPGDLYLPTVIAHELSHAWIGNLVSICRGVQIDMWLIEGLATWISRTAVADIVPGSTPWAPSTAATLPDHAYAPNVSAIRQLETLIGQQAITAGLGDFLRAHSHGNATIDDLVQCWSKASARDLTEWAAAALHPHPITPRSVDVTGGETPMSGRTRGDVHAIAKSSWRGRTHLPTVGAGMCYARELLPDFAARRHRLHGHRAVLASETERRVVSPRGHAIAETVPAGTSRHWRLASCDVD
jgi:hypothetical protein